MLDDIYTPDQRPPMLKTLENFLYQHFEVSNKLTALFSSYGGYSQEYTACHQ
jgi:hypothetical protein